MNMDVYQEFTTIPYGQQHDIIYMVSIYGPRQAPGSSSRAPVDLVCVLDKSGSMKGPKLELVQKTMTFVVEQLQDSDRLALVTFDTEVSTISPLQNMTKKGKSESLNALQRIHAGSSTNLSGGIIAALKILQKRETVLDVTSVMVFTDGQANQGIKNTDEIVQCLQLIMPSIPQCSIFTFGFGTDTNATMLRAIADSGNGLYYYIATLEDVPSSFADCLGGLLSVSARNVQVDLCLEGGCSLVDVLSTYKRTGSRNNSQVSLVIGDLYSEEHKDLLYLINLPPLNSPTSKYIVGKAILTYLCVESDKNERLETELSVSRSSNEIVGIPNVEVDKQRNRLTATMALQHAVTLGDQGNYQQARKAITDAIGTISKSTSKDEEFCTQLVDDLQKAWLSCDPRMYQCGGSQVMNTVMQCHQQQRSPCNSMHSSLASYSTTSKQLMVQAAQRSLGLGIPFEGESGNSIGPSSFRCTPPPAAKPASATLPIRPSSSSHHTPKLTPRAPTNLSPSSTLPHRKISTSATTTSHSSAAIRSSSAVQPSKKQDQSPKPKAASSSTVTRRVTTRASPRVEANPSPKVSTRKAVASS